MTKKIGMVSLGCSKNQVDAERLLAQLRAGGYTLCENAQECDGVIINTCAFVEAAKQESIDTILEFCAQKRPGQKKAVIVTGCLAERYRDMVKTEIPEVDAVIGIGCNSNILSALDDVFCGRSVLAFGDKTALSLEGDRVLANPGYYAYLKVAEGCDNRCSYCAIPLIRGGFRSRPMKNILTEARMLAEQGVTELNVVAQDTTRYGQDLYGRVRLPELLKSLCLIPGIRWIRVLYAYPERVTDELLQVMAEEEKVVKYLDIPVQHCNGDILRKMNRPGNKERLLELLEKIRRYVPDMVLRTTLIAGFPGETEEQFEELCNFVREAKFARLGCFPYSQEEDTPAADFPQQLPEDVKNRRAEILMETQYPVAMAFMKSKLGSACTVLTEGMEEGYYVGRSEMDAPDIDTRVYFQSDVPLSPGDYVAVELCDLRDYDFLGKVVKQP